MTSFGHHDADDVGHMLTCSHWYFLIDTDSKHQPPEQAIAAVIDARRQSVCSAASALFCAITSRSRHLSLAYLRRTQTMKGDVIALLSISIAVTCCRSLHG